MVDLLAFPKTPQPSPFYKSPLHNAEDQAKEGHCQEDCNEDPQKGARNHYYRPAGSKDIEGEENRCQKGKGGTAHRPKHSLPQPFNQAILAGMHAEY